MGLMRGGGMGMGMRGEGTPHGCRAPAGREELPKRKPNWEKMGPQIWALVTPRKCLLLAGLGLMPINRVDGPEFRR